MMSGQQLEKNCAVLKKARAARRRPTQCKWGHPLNERTISKYKNRERCIICNIIRRLAYAGNHDPGTRRQRAAEKNRARNNVARERENVEPVSILPPSHIVPVPDLSGSHAEWMLYHGFKKKRTLNGAD